MGGSHVQQLWALSSIAMASEKMLTAQFENLPLWPGWSQMPNSGSMLTEACGRDYLTGSWWAHHFSEEGCAV